MNIQLPVYFTASAALQERAGLRAIIRQVAFAPELDAPEERPYPFVYTIGIRNDSPEAVTIKARKWVITDIASGCRHVTEGDGVVGICPRIDPGQVFEYQSYHVVAHSSRAEGAYLACDDAGVAMLIRVPAFSMNVPHRDGQVQ